MFRTLPPTGAPVPLRSLLGGIGTLASGSDTREKFQHRLRNYFGVRHAFALSSGKAALLTALRVLEKLSGRREIIIPAYSSFCLASVAARSGLAVKLCDVDPETFDFDLDMLESLITERTLAVVPVHNYGLVCNMSRIQELARSRGAVVVEDAAQAAGAAWGSRKAGTVGDVGIVSFARGKNICTLGGGAILTDEDRIAEGIAGEVGRHSSESAISGASDFAVGVALSLFLNPERYFVPSSLPFLHLGANVFDPGFAVGTLPALNAAVGQDTFSKLDHYNAVRVRNARLLRESLNTGAGVQLPKEHPGAYCVYLRLPVLFEDSEKRDKALQLLITRKLGATASYPTPLDQIAEFKRHIDSSNDLPGARSVARSIVTLPTHPFVRENDLLRIVETLHNL